MASAEHGSHQPVRATDPQPDSTLAKDLASEDILEILRMILADASLKEVLTSVALSCGIHGQATFGSCNLIERSLILSTSAVLSGSRPLDDFLYRNMLSKRRIDWVQNWVQVKAR